MQTELEITKTLELSEVKQLAGGIPPCITIQLPLEPTPNRTEQEFRRLKALIRRAEEELRGMESDPRLTTELITSLEAVSAEGGSWGGAGGTLVVLRSPDVFRAFEIRDRLDERVQVGTWFNILPIIHSLQVGSQVFYLLGLSQKHVRLLRCTPSGAEEVSLGAETPVSLEQWLNTRLPNSAPTHGATQESDTGSTAGSFTSTHDRDNKDEHLANFYRVINKAVFDTLRGQRAPLVLCGVDYERSMYQGLNTYGELVEEGVQGSPESLKGGEMHARALEVVQEYFSRPAKKALGVWDNVAGSERALKAFPDIVKAAFEARIAQLFVAANARAMGVFDRERMQMGVQGRQEDLVNAAALQTFAFGGEVFIVKPEHVPGGGQMAAITRF